MERRVDGVCVFRQGGFTSGRCSINRATGVVVVVVAGVQCPPEIGSHCWHWLHCLASSHCWNWVRFGLATVDEIGYIIWIEKSAMDSCMCYIMQNAFFKGVDIWSIHGQAWQWAELSRVWGQLGLSEPSRRSARLGSAWLGNLWAEPDINSARDCSSSARLVQLSSFRLGKSRVK